MKYSFISFLLAWIFPTKIRRKQFRRFCANIDSDIENNRNIKIVHKRYSKLVNKLSKDIRTRKLRVLFLCSENEKWAYQSLYEKLQVHPNFEPVIAVSVLESYLSPEYEFMHYKDMLKKNYEFFKNKGMNVEYAFNPETNEYINLSKFSPDIIFYEQPWGMADIHKSHNTSKFALSCHCSYGTSITNGAYEYEHPFYRQLF